MKDKLNYEKTILENGIKIVSQNIPNLNSFSIGFWILVGSKNENKFNNGITHFIEHCVFKGTKTKSSKQIALSLESRGGYINAFTTKEHTCFYSRGLKEDLPLAVDVLSDLILNPKFDEKEIKKEAGVIAEEILAYEDNPDENIFELLEKELYGEHSLGLPIVGNIHNVNKFDRAQLIDFMKKYYHSENILITAIGNVNHKDLIKEINKYFYTNPIALADNKLKEIKLSNKKKDVNFVKDVNQVYTCFGRKTFGAKSKMTALQNALNLYIGEGASSKLFLNIREKYGLAYNIFSFINTYYDTSTFGIYTSTSEKNEEKLYELIWKELDRIKDKKISESELSRIKRQLIGGLILSLENPVNRLTSYAQSEMYFNRIRTVEEIIDLINKLNVKDFYEFENYLLDKNQFTTVRIMPNKKV